MKILLVTDFLQPQTHGIAIRFEQYIKHIKKNKDHQITVYGPKNCPSTDKYLYSIKNYWNKDNNICFPSFELIYDICVNKYDIIHLVYPPCISAIFIFIVSLFIPLNIVTSNHVNLNYYSKVYNMKFLHYIVKYLIYAPQYYFAKRILAPATLEDFKIAYNYETEVIPSGIDLDEFYYVDKPRDNILIYVGRLSPEKNINKLIKQFDLIKNYKLLIVGDGPSESSLKQQAINNKNIEFLGKKPHNELPYYYQIAKAHVTFSESETYGLTLLESLACGTPIIYPSCVVFNDLYKKDFGKLCMDDDNNLQNIINYIEQNEPEIQLACKKYSEQHSWKKATDKLLDIYKDVSRSL